MPTRANAARGLRAPTPNFRALALVCGVASGAGAAALQLLTGPPATHHEPRISLLAADIEGSDAMMAVGGAGPQASRLVPQRSTSSPREEAAQLVAAEEITRERIEREKARERAQQRAAAERERAAAQRQRQREAAERAAQRQVVAPVRGTITSNYGPRWGFTHYGLDIANDIGTPIRAAMSGVVIEAGPASGFGLWVRIQHEDGTITVYGHINSYSVSVGQRVEAGEVIAEVGNRGRSTGPHLHFEVWASGGKKLNPLAWLRQAGVEMS